MNVHATSKWIDHRDVGGGEFVVLFDYLCALQELLLLVFGVKNRTEALQLLQRAVIDDLRRKSLASNIRGL